MGQYHRRSQRTLCQLNIACAKVIDVLRTGRQSTVCSRQITLLICNRWMVGCSTKYHAEIQNNPEHLAEIPHGMDPALMKISATETNIQESWSAKS